MCDWYYVTRLDGRSAEVETSTQLALIVCCRVENLPTSSGRTMGEDECLCDLDVETFERAFGYRFEEGDTSFDLRLVEVPE